MSEQKVEGERQLRVFRNLADNLLRDTTLEEILRSAVGSAIAELGFAECSIFLLDTERGVLIEKAAMGSRGFEDFRSRNPFEIPIGTGLVGHCAATNTASLVSNLENNPHVHRGSTRSQVGIDRADQHRPTSFWRH